MLTFLDLKKELKTKANSKKAKILQRFFKTGPGEYGEGDVFLGIVVPDIRKLVKKYTNLEIKEITNIKLLFTLRNKKGIEKNLLAKKNIEKIIYSAENIKISLFYNENPKNLAEEKNPALHEQGGVSGRNPEKENSVFSQNEKFVFHYSAPYT